VCVYVCVCVLIHSLTSHTDLAEAFTKLEHYQKLYTVIGDKAPFLANITEFGQTPLYSREELGAVGVSMVNHCSTVALATLL